jgi:hypothetical protein
MCCSLGRRQRSRPWRPRCWSWCLGRGRGCNGRGRGCGGDRGAQGIGRCSQGQDGVSQGEVVAAEANVMVAATEVVAAARRSRSWPQRPRSWPQQLRRCPTFNNIINVSTVRASRALLRCWDPAHGPNGGAPTSPSIIAGHKRVWGKHLGEPRAVNGRMVGDRSGHRRGGETHTSDGKRKVGPAPWEGEGQWLHSDAQLAQDLKFERCTAQGDTVGET